MIKFRTVFDSNSTKSLNKHTIKKQFWIYILVSIFLIASGIYDLTLGGGEVGEFLILFGLLFTPALLLVAHISQKNVDKSMTLFQGETVEIYEFNEEGICIQTSKGEEYFSLTRTKYSYLYRVDETAENYFLYISKLQCHVVEKKYLIEGTIEELNELFARNLGERFHEKKK